jgi:hypothetical protein
VLSSSYKKCFFALINTDDSETNKIMFNRLNILIKNVDKRLINIIIISLHYFVKVGVDNSVDLEAEGAQAYYNCHNPDFILN